MWFHLRQMPSTLAKTPFVSPAKYFVTRIYTIDCTFKIHFGVYTYSCLHVGVLRVAASAPFFSSTTNGFVCILFLLLYCLYRCILKCMWLSLSCCLWTQGRVPNASAKANGDPNKQTNSSFFSSNTQNIFPWVVFPLWPSTVQ